MSVPVWCADLTAAFWAVAWEAPPFPRDLRLVVAQTVPFSVIDAPGLSVAAVSQWFADIGIPLALDEPDRPLRGCLVASRGHGFAFLDARDDLAEQRFTLAHELGHFLRDYWHPRQRAIARLGSQVQEVLDGERPATLDERLHAVLRNVPVGPFTHLLRRDESGRPLSFAERQAEADADRLAFELLAPVAALGEIGRTRELLERLIDEFGLPRGPAERYAAILKPEPATHETATARFLIV